MAKLTAAVEADADGGYRFVLYVGKRAVARSGSSKSEEKKKSFIKSANLINAAAVGTLEVPKE